jgi:hypothetical protein
MKVKGQFGGTPQNGDRQHRVAAARQPKGPPSSLGEAKKAAPVLQALRLNLAEVWSRILGTRRGRAARGCAAPVGLPCAARLIWAARRVQ